MVLIEIGSKALARDILFVRERGLFLSVYVDGKEEAQLGSHVEEVDEQVDLKKPTPFLDHVNWGCTQRECMPKKTKRRRVHTNVPLTDFRRS